MGMRVRREYKAKFVCAVLGVGALLWVGNRFVNPCDCHRTGTAALGAEEGEPGHQEVDVTSKSYRVHSLSKLSGT